MDNFTVGMKSTQRSESMNNVLQQGFCKTMNLTEFLQYYEEQCKKMRLSERHENYRRKHGMPKLEFDGSKMLLQAASVFTIKIYKLFAKQFVSSLTVHPKLASLSIYHLLEAGYKRHPIVDFNSSTCSIVCSCKMSESQGRYADMHLKYSMCGVSHRFQKSIF